MSTRSSTEKNFQKEVKLPTANKFVVHKFGGTSVANAERYQQVAQIMDKEPGQHKAIVVSAMSKVTDALIELVHLASSRQDSYLEKLETLKQRHFDTIDRLLSGAVEILTQPSVSTNISALTLAKDLKSKVMADFEDIKEILRGLWLVQSASMPATELVSGYGEIWSAQFLNAYLNSLGQSSTWLDARQVLVVEPGETSVVVDWESSQKKMNQWLQEHSHLQRIVITGFIASTKDGIPTTLKRNGSDFSASIFGALLDSKHITIWTDVDGVLSADPRLVPEAVVLEDMSYSEATELAYFGAKVVHPSTMAPAIQRQIPIWIRNTFHSNKPGTLIHKNSQSTLPVKGFSTIENVALINVEGTGMIGIPGVAQRLFGALREVNISVIMISQASSEQSICFAIPSAQAELAKSTLEKTFFAELHHGFIQKIEVSSQCSVLAAVGDNMVSQPGIAARFFGALGQAGINIRAIAQGSSERNISVVIERRDSTKALRAVHAGFFLSNHTLSVGVIGTGWIGKTFLSQLHRAAANLKQEHKIDIRVRGIANSKQMILQDQSIDLSQWETEIKNSSSLYSIEKLISHLLAEHIPHAVLIDCTADPSIANQYADWLKKGLHIITPNKKANAGPYAYYQELQKAVKNSHRHYLYETTVGAGLPIINTLKDLIRTGDQIIEIEGILSGTLSYIFNNLNLQNSFSDVVQVAKDKGYTEPDPRDDLSGTDVARKLIILGREMGLSIEMSDIQVSSLVPESMQKLSVEEFMKSLPTLNQQWQEKLQDAESRGEVLRYVGRLSVNSPDEAASSLGSVVGVGTEKNVHVSVPVNMSVELRSYPKTHAFAMVRATDNIVAFRTMRYRNQPLIVQGPGAGPDVTAAGVFADLLRLASYLGAVI
jgi:aspartokinase/homoserine dehydrogenase 1